MREGLCGGPSGQRDEVPYADDCRCLQQGSAGDRSGQRLRSEHVAASLNRLAEPVLNFVCEAYYAGS